MWDHVGNSGACFASGGYYGQVVCASSKPRVEVDSLIDEIIPVSAGNTQAVVMAITVGLAAILTIFQL